MKTIAPEITQLNKELLRWEDFDEEQHVGFSPRYMYLAHISWDDDLYRGSFRLKVLVIRKEATP